MSKHARHAAAEYGEWVTPWRSTPQPAYPTKMDAEGPYSNPTYTIPPISPEKALLGYWSGGPFRVPEPGVGNTAVWESPIFDLRPDLKAVTGISPQIAQPIRSADMAGIRLRVQFQVDAGDLNGGGSQLAARQQTVEAVELGHLTDPALITTLNQPQSIISAIYSGGQSAIVSWVPAADNARFWRVRLIFGQGVGGAVVGNVSLSAACY